MTEKNNNRKGYGISAYRILLPPPSILPDAGPEVAAGEQHRQGPGIIFAPRPLVYPSTTLYGVHLAHSVEKNGTWKLLTLLAND